MKHFFIWKFAKDYFYFLQRNTVTTPEATTVTNSIDVEDFGIDELQETTTILPRQNRNREFGQNALQPDFGVDVLGNLSLLSFQYKKVPFELE